MISLFNTLRAAIGTWLLRGVKIELEIRHGPYRIRVRHVWHGGLIRAEIPVSGQKNTGSTTPLGFIPGGKEQELINEATEVVPHNPCPLCQGRGTA